MKQYLCTSLWKCRAFSSIRSSATAVLGEHEGAPCTVTVVGHVDACPGAEGQVGEEVASAQGGQQEVLRVVQRGIAPEQRIRSGDQVRLPRDPDQVLTGIPVVGGRAFAEVAAPLKVERVVVRIGHERKV